MRQEHTRNAGWMLAGGALVAVGYVLGGMGAGAREAAAQPQQSERERPQSMIPVGADGYAIVVDHSNFAYIVAADGKAVRVQQDTGRNEFLRVR